MSSKPRQNAGKISSDADSNSAEEEMCCVPPEQILGEDLTINRLPELILLQILSYLPRSDRLVKAAPVCWYWKKLTLDPYFWHSCYLEKETALDDVILHKITRYSRNVQSVVLGCRSKVTDDGLIDVVDHCNALQNLELLRCKQFTKRSLNYIGEKLSRLTTITLMACLNLTDEALIKIARGCSQLSGLRVNLNDCITDKSIVVVAHSCKYLKYLDISFTMVTDISIRELIKEKRKLETLIFHETKISSSGSKLLSRMPSLKTLVANRYVDDEVLLALAKGLPNLSVLDLQYTEINEVSCAGLVNSTTYLQRVVDLQINGFRFEVDDAVLESIGKHCRSLERLKIGYSPFLTEIGIKAVMTGCTQLTLLFVVVYRDASQCINKENVKTLVELTAKYKQLRIDVY